MGLFSRPGGTQPLMETLEPRLMLSTWYVRPYGGSAVTYGAENGTSYENAWDGLSRVVWGSSGVKAGDTLYVCGTHPNPNFTSQYGGSTLNSNTYLVIGASGTAGAPITIRGDYPGDPGRVLRVTREYKFNLADPAADGWTTNVYNQNGYNFTYYTRTIGGGSTSRIVMDLATGTVQQLIWATDTPANTPAQWTGDGVGYSVFDGTYYYKPRSGTTETLVYTDGIPYAFKNVGQDYITLKSLYVSGGNASRGLIYLTNGADHCVMDGLTIQYSGALGIVVDRYDANDVQNAGLANNYGEIKNCFINWVQSGIYMISGTYKHSDWWIHDNTILNTYQDDRNGVADYHGICMESGSNHVVERNVIKHTGTVGILLDCKEGSTTPSFRGISNNITIRYNWIEDIHTARTDQGGGINVSTTFDNHNPDNNVNCKAYDNIIIDAIGRGSGGTALGKPSSPSLGDPWVWANNLLVNNGTSTYTTGYPSQFYSQEPTGATPSWDGAFSLYNTLFLNSPKQHIWSFTNDGLDADMNVDYNLYDANGFEKWYGGYYPYTAPVTHRYSTLADWQTGQGKDVHSSVADALFADKTAKDFHLLWNSPAIDAGLQWWEASDIKAYGGALIDMVDYDGKPIYGTPDIGPFEYQPPYMMGVDAVAANSSVRIYADGKFRQLTAAGATAASLAVAPAAGWGTFTSTQQRAAWMDLAVSTWQTAGTYARVWTETGSTLGSTATAHTIGGLAPNTNYNLAVNGVWGSGVSGSGMAGGLVRSDASGQISFTYNGGYVSAPTFALSKAVWGDFNNDGLVNAADIDTMMAEIRNSGNRSPFDLTLDTQVTQADADNLVQTVLHTFYGDADLNGMVDQRDYAAWFNHNAQTAGWADGNFTSDTLVDQQDYAQWYNHNGLSGATSQAGSISLAISQESTPDGLLGLADVPATKPATNALNFSGQSETAGTDLLDVLSMPSLSLLLA